ncbi:MAG TPA: hypothetical protein VME46_20675 [Acidimicrobiales bacterium]|nr:hypothetical protein [Acidimicrobiales bacterium]
MLLEVGYVGRPHGLHGEVVVQLVSTVAERLSAGSCLQCQGRELIVEASRPLPGRARSQGSHWLVSFAGVTTRPGAESLTGAVLRAEPEPGAAGLWVHELIGCQVFDQGGVTRGQVVAVEANPASDLLVLDTAALVPLRFVISVTPGRVEVDVPEGLFEL